MKNSVHQIYLIPIYMWVLGHLIINFNIKPSGSQIELMQEHALAQVPWNMVGMSIDGTTFCVPLYFDLSGTLEVGPFGTNINVDILKIYDSPKMKNANRISNLKFITQSKELSGGWNCKHALSLGWFTPTTFVELNVLSFKLRFETISCSESW